MFSVFRSTGRGLRGFATGPAASATKISDELLAKIGGLSTQALIDGLWVMGWPPAHIEGARPLAPGQKCCGRAVTLNFMPVRPDITADKPPGMLVLSTKRSSSAAAIAFS